MTEASEQQTYLLLGRLEGKLDAVLSKAVEQDHRMDANDDRQDSQDKRIGKLETAKAWLWGAFIAFGFGWSAGISYFLYFNGKH